VAPACFLALTFIYFKIVRLFETEKRIDVFKNPNLLDVMLCFTVDKHQCVRGTC